MVIAFLRFPDLPDVGLEQHGLSHVCDSAEDHQAAVSHRDHGVLAEHDRLAPERKKDRQYNMSSSLIYVWSFSPNYIMYNSTGMAKQGSP